MSKNGNPPSLLAFRRKSFSGDENIDDDRAFLLPSNSSSFNLLDDTEVIKSSRSYSSNRSKKKARKSNRRQLSQPPTPTSADGQAGGEMSLHSIPSKDSIRSNRSSANHSGNSYKNQDGSPDSVNVSNRSGRSMKRRMKIKRLEKRGEWMQRHRRRQIVGTICLTLIYSLLFLYTVIITIGPLALNFWVDIRDWCPYYYDESWQDNIHNAYFLDFDNAVSIDMLQRTSNDIHQHKQLEIDENDENPEVDQEKYDNPDYNNTPCHVTRIPSLFYLTLEECDLSRRMAASIIFGGFIGYERRASDRPAGIRTMALVALGSCFFTLSSQLAFRDSPMTWDSSRVSAAIPSGVGFLGAGLIWKGSLNNGSGEEVHQVHGITTAASVWLAAAVGVGAGGALYAVTAYSTALIVIVLRFGPRLYFQNDRGFEDDDEEDESEDEDASLDGPNNPNVSERQESMVGVLSVPEKKEDELNYVHKGYGATDVDEHIESETAQGKVGPCCDNKLLSWLMKLTPSKGRNRPPNPYQEFANDKEVKRLIMKKITMKKTKSGVSFCT